ncbi:unnamed protein product [Cylindrotheca closterium]|uniref:RNA helicase n=1 Tax=Cylindrotheca closterium TaxID=2856 RepID=A0AAD2CL29_9STRA|nr:unnamed protein product [Cylindrotheca closterium]
MGRYNNRRTQAAAEALKNTPSRARFSKGPPKRQKKKNNRDTSNNTDSNGNNNGGNQKNPRVGRHPNTAATARVIDKIQNRQQEASQKTKQRVATTEEALSYIDKSKLDKVTLPGDILEVITNLLENLGVKESARSKRKDDHIELEKEMEMDQDVNDQVPIDDDNVTEDISEAPDAESEEVNRRRKGAASNVGYAEYGDDVEEEAYYQSVGQIGGGLMEEAEWEGEVKVTSDQEISNESEVKEDEIPERIHKEAAFIYLTQRLSFSKTNACRACLAIENWDIHDDDNKKDDEAKSAPKKSNEAISLAMDWLCLHLSEAELSKGFLTNQDTNKSSSTVMPSINIKVVPHPSISVAKSITSDKEWSRNVRIQEKILKFVKMGFHHSEASGICEAIKDIEAMSKIDEYALLLELLESLEEKACEGSKSGRSKEPLNAADLEFAAEERKQEIEVLQAIYAEQVDIIAGYRDSDISNYSLKIVPVEELEEPAKSEDCQLEVFPRSGYPVVEAPLLLFSNPSLPPTLLRRINDEIARKAVFGVGVPVVYEIASFLAESIHEMQIDFIKQQRRKEFEAEQLRIRKQGHGVIAQASEVEVEGGKLGRRQKAKLRAAEMAYDRDEQIEKEFEGFRQRQEERIHEAKHQSSRIRSVMAEQTLAEREKQRVEAEAERAARAAMNDAFNRGESVSVAREMAKNARILSLKENGIVEDAKLSAESSHHDEQAEESIEEAPKVSQPESTPTTAAFIDGLAATGESTYHDEGTPMTNAFMDRLRQMYDDAAKQKAGIKSSKSDENEAIQVNGEKTKLEMVRLNKPERDASDNELVHIPRPVPVLSGEMGDMMNDVIDQQKNQPWLVSPEARVPTMSDDNGAKPGKPSQRQHNISKKLREELERKRDQAEQWAEKNVGSANNSKSTGSHFYSPKRFHSLWSVRQRLPAYQMHQEIVATIKHNQITVIAGDTGCGKTTQVPQLVLDDLILNGQGASANIIVTQPRRISAIGVSERIADERCEKVGESCGYSIKLEKKLSNRTRLLLCTTGILLRRLQCDPDLASVSHIFVDEVHERDLNTDFLLIIVKDLLARRKDLKLILMSATLNSDAFAKYFSGCPVVSIPGRAHPVQEFRLEDVLQMTGHQVQEGGDFALPANDKRPPKVSKSALRKLYYPKYSKETIHSLSIIDEEKINYPLLADLLEHISTTQEEGAILVFMPGMMEITKAIDEMYKKEIFQSSKVVIYPLHSSLSSAEQKAIFDVPPQGVRKIVVSTNIAETSITIEDVVYVVDSGKLKENRRDEVNETPTLVECWVSRASAKQRRGRAGRVRPGIAYHLFSSHTHDKSLEDYQLPEMLRVGIEDIVLQILILDLGEPTSFLSKALNPPSDLAMSNSLNLLETLGAVECSWQERSGTRRPTSENDSSTDKNCGDLKVSSELTALGFHLATLPVDPRVGKMMIYGALLGCTDPALTIAASMSARSPFLSPFDQRDAADAARAKFAAECSDHLTILNAFKKWKDVFREEGHRGVKSFLKDNFLGRLTLNQMEDQRRQFAGLLKDIGFLPKSFQLKSLNNVENANSANTGLLKAVLCAGLYPNIIVAPRELACSNSKKAAGEHAFRSYSKGDVYLHPSSIAFGESKLDSRYCCYHEMVRTSKTYVRDCTTVSIMALLLFGGKLEVYQAHGICSIDGWLKFKIDAKPATLVKYLRSQMERILLRKILSPEEDVVGTEDGKALISSISLLFQREAEEKASIPDRSGGEIVRPWTGSDDNERNRGSASNDRSGARGGRGGNGRRQGGRSGGGSGGRGGGRGRGRQRRD